MEANDKIRIQKNMVYLKENCEPRDVTDELYCSNVLTEEHVEKIRGKETCADRTREMTSILLHRGPEAYGKFLNALRNSKYDYVADILEATIVSEDEIKAFEDNGMGTTEGTTAWHNQIVKNITDNINRVVIAKLVLPSIQAITDVFVGESGAKNALASASEEVPSQETAE